MSVSNNFVLIRVDANQNLGAGHLMRCMALAYALRENGIIAHFVIDSQTATLIQTFVTFDFDFTELNSVEPEIQQIKACYDFLGKSYACLALVLDGYQFSSAYRQQLNEIGAALVVLDDQNNSGVLYADLVVNPLNAAKEMNYSETAPNAKHLFGPGYVLLQPSFQRAKPAEWSCRKHLLITFGASDVQNLSLPVLSALLNEASPFSDVTLVTGAAYSYEMAIRECLAKSHSSKSSIRYLHRVQDMTQPMREARLALSAAGSTQFELASMRVPSLLVVVADNQLAAATEQASLGWCDVVDARKGIQMTSLLRQVAEIWNDEERLLSMHYAATKLNYLDGAMRIVRSMRQIHMQAVLYRQIEAYGVILKPVAEVDLELIREWRNDPQMRQHMIDQADISKVQQVRWFEHIRHAISQQHYLITYKEHAIGVINIKSVDHGPLFQAEEIEVGLYISHPRYRNNFLAFCPSLTILDYCFDELCCQKIVARVLPHNQSAINYNRQLGYVVSSEQKAQYELIHMQLDPESYRAASRKIKSLIRY